MGVIKEAALNLEDIEVSHTLGGAYPQHTLCNGPPHVGLQSKPPPLCFRIVRGLVQEELTHFACPN